MRSMRPSTVMPGATWTWICFSENSVLAISLPCVSKYRSIALMPAARSCSRSAGYANGAFRWRSMSAAAESLVTMSPSSARLWISDSASCSPLP